jgi:predicted secreted protein
MLNGSVIAGAKSCRINVKVGTNEVSSPTDGQWKHSIVALKSWSVSTDNLMMFESTSDTPIKDAINRVGLTYTLSFVCSELSGDTLSGDAHCLTFVVVATKNALMQGSFEFEGTGPLQ